MIRLNNPASDFSSSLRVRLKDHGKRYFLCWAYVPVFSRKWGGGGGAVAETNHFSAKIFIFLVNIHLRTYLPG